jgi:tRNA(Ile)-lysidine synthase TilS/MesJ
MEIAMIERCVSCILPKDLPGMNIDEEGNCHYCRQAQYRPIEKALGNQEETKKRFETMIEKWRGKGRYDCLVPLSGGKESSYVLYVLVKDYNLKPLVFTLANGFQHPDAVNNIENLVDQLGVDLLIYRPNMKLFYKLFREFLSQAGY